MSLLLADSFSHYDEAQIPLKWSSVSNAHIDTTHGRWGGRCLYFSGGGNVVGVIPARTTIYAGVAFYMNQHDTISALGFWDTGTNQLQLQVDAYGFLKLYYGLTPGSTPGWLIDSSEIALGTGTWYYIELGATIDNTAGSYEVRVNGTAVMSGSGVKTQMSANSSANRIVPAQGGASGLTKVYANDFYACDDTDSGVTGAPNNDFLGDIRVQALMPSADGDSSDFVPSTGTDHYSLVNEIPPNGDTTYVSSSNVGDTDLYEMGDLAALSGVVLGVQWVGELRKDDAGTRTIAPVIKVGSTTDEGDEQGLGTSYTFYRQIWEASPDTGDAFTVSEVNGMQAGVKVSS